MAQTMLGAVLWQLGYPDQARARFRQAIAWGQELDQPSSLAFSHFMAMMTTSVLGRDLATALGHHQALRPLGQLNLVYGAWAELLSALEQTQAGTGSAQVNCAQGVARTIEALSSWQSAGSGAGYAALLWLQAEVCVCADQPELGLEAMDRAKAWIDRTGMRPMEAEVWRMRGEMLLRLDDRGLASSGVSHPATVAEAEACFHRALEVAREQGSRWWELRAAMSLVRLRARQGEAYVAELAEARGYLQEMVQGFTEGLALPDLQEAEALIGE